MSGMAMRVVDDLKRLWRESRRQLVPDSAFYRHGRFSQR
jgi:hypothetical protein